MHAKVSTTSQTSQYPIIQSPSRLLLLYFYDNTYNTRHVRERANVITEICLS